MSQGLAQDAGSENADPAVTFQNGQLHLVHVLLAAGAITAGLGEYVDSAVILNRTRR